MPDTESRTRKHRLAAGLAIATGCWALLAAVHAAGSLEPFDLRLLDLKFALRGQRQAADSIAIVGVDDPTIRAYGAWPIPRDAYALLLAGLEEAGAKAVGVDLQFPTDGNQDPRWDELLAHVSGASDNVVHAIWFHSPGARTARAGPVSGIPEPLTRRGTMMNLPGIAVAGTASVPYDGLLEAAPHLGHVTVSVDRDGAIRRAPLFVRYGDRCYDALGVELYGVQRGAKSRARLVRSRGGDFLAWPDGPSMPIQIDRQGSTSIDFAGSADAFPNTYSMLEVLQWYRDGNLSQLRATFGGRVVLIGLTSSQEVSEDVGPTPFGAATPLLFVHANVLDNLNRGRFLHRLEGAPYFAGLLAYALLVGLFAASVSVPVAAIVTVVSTILVAAASQASLALASVEIPSTLCLAIAPCIYAGTASYRILFLEKRARTREADIREGLSLQQQLLPGALIGKKVAHYLIEERLGAGGMGVVYRAQDASSGRSVALKVLSAVDLADDKMRRRFRHEAVALARLDHPNIAKLLEFDTHHGIDFIAMEFVPGTTLRDRLLRGPVPSALALDIASQVCGALGEAHRHGILHRDLKPANVMLADRNHVKLLDFGIARFTDVGATMATLTGSLTDSGQVIGTLAYMAPEILRGERADERTDVYGVGMLLYEMLAGRRPYPDEQPHELMYMILNQPPPKPSVLNGSIDRTVEAIVLRCLAKDPAERPESADALRALVLAESREGKPA